jgi:hypothetical protein
MDQSTVNKLVAQAKQEGRDEAFKEAAHNAEVVKEVCIIDELCHIAARRKDISFWEGVTLDDGIEILQSSDIALYNKDTGKSTRLDCKQAPFVKHILPTMILESIPLLEDVLKLYGLTLYTLFTRHQCSQSTSYIRTEMP